VSAVAALDDLVVDRRELAEVLEPAEALFLEPGKGPVGLCADEIVGGDRNRHESLLGPYIWLVVRQRRWR
jgi:hypothetical protein